MSLIDQLKGTGVALVTPFKKEGLVDYDALQKVIDYVIDGGVQYLVSLGTTGETPVLSKEEKEEIFEFTCTAAKSRVPVVIGSGGNSTQGVIKEMEAFNLDKA